MKSRRQSFRLLGPRSKWYYYNTGKHRRTQILGYFIILTGTGKYLLQSPGDGFQKEPGKIHLKMYFKN